MRRSLPKPRFRTTATGGRKMAIRIKTNLFTIFELRACGNATPHGVPPRPISSTERVAENKARLIRNRRTVPPRADPQPGPVCRPLMKMGVPERPKRRIGAQGTGGAAPLSVILGDLGPVRLE